MESGRNHYWLHSGTAAEILINVASSAAFGQNEEEPASKLKEESDIWTSIISCIQRSTKLGEFMTLKGAN